MLPKHYWAAMPWFKGRNNIVLVKSSKAGRFLPVDARDASQYPFIYINLNSYAVVHVDVDSPDSDAIIPEAFDLDTFHGRNLQLPNFTIRTSGQRFQAYWLLENSLPLRPSPKSMAFYQDVRCQLIHALNADPACNLRGAARNPLYTGKLQECRCFHLEPYTLNELNPGIRVPRKFFKHCMLPYEQGCRNKSTFLAALSHYKRHGESASLEEVIAFIDDFQAKNAEAGRLSASENASIAKSVLANGHRYGGLAKRNYGAAGLPSVEWGDLTVKERKEEVRARQAAGAYYVHQARKAKTHQRLAQGFHALLRSGQRLSQRNLAQQTGLGIATVKRHWRTVKDWYHMVNR